MSEFHGYALRKHTMRCYTSILAWQDTLTSHPFYQRACRGVLTIYLHLLDCPEDTDGLGHLTTVPSAILPPSLSPSLSFLHFCTPSLPFLFVLPPICCCCFTSFLLSLPTATFPPHCYCSNNTPLS